MAELQQYTVISEGLECVGDVDLYLFHSVPKGPCRGRMLLLGGSNFDLRIKRAFRNSELVNQFEFVTYEPRGLSRSSLPTGNWTMADYARDAHQVLKHLGWAEAVVVGESFGGMTALQLALDFPERVRALITTSATAGGDGGCSVDLLPLLNLELGDFSRQMLQQQDRRNQLLEIEDAEQFAQKLRQRMAEDQQFLETSGVSGGYARLLQARKSHDVWERVHQITSPALVMAGEFDQQAPVEAQRRLAERLPCAEFSIQEGGHGFLFAAGPQAQTKILDWIESSKLTD